MTLPHISPTPDITILGVLAILVVYGLILGRHKVKTLALSVYVGLVISTELSAGLYQLLSSRHIDLGGQLNPTNVALGLFILPLLVLELGRKGSGSRGDSKGGITMTLILCSLTAALAVSAGLKLLEPSALQHILGESTLATVIYHLRLWWIALVPVAVIGENFIRSKD